MQVRLLLGTPFLFFLLGRPPRFPVFCTTVSLSSSRLFPHFGARKHTLSSPSLFPCSFSAKDKSRGAPYVPTSDRCSTRQPNAPSRPPTAKPIQNGTSAPPSTDSLPGRGGTGWALYCTGYAATHSREGNIYFDISDLKLKIKPELIAIINHIAVSRQAPNRKTFPFL